MLAFDCITGSHKSLHETGGGVMMMHHQLGQTCGEIHVVCVYIILNAAFIDDERVGESGHSVGGMGAITQAMEKVTLLKPNIG
jgi:cephalosporin-C deacetylase-like acetyl esterase